MSKNTLKGLFVVFSTGLLLSITACENTDITSAQSPGAVQDIREVGGASPKLEMPPVSPAVKN